MTRQSTLTEIKTRRQSIPIENKLVDTRAYYYALKEREKTKLLECEATGTDVADLPYGVYEGATQRELRYEIDGIIKENQPEKVRERQTKQMLREGRKTGRLLEQKKVLSKFDSMMSRKYDPRKGRLLKKNEVASVSSRDTGRLYLPPMPVERSLMNLNSRKSYVRTGLTRSVTYAPVPSPGA